MREYILDGNATQAAIRAGYSPRTAKVQGSRLLTRANLRAAVASAQQRKTERAQEKIDATLDNVVEELAKIAFANQLDYIRICPDGDPFIDLSKLTREQAAAIQEMTVEDYLDGRGKDARTVRKVR